MRPKTRPMQTRWKFILCTILLFSATAQAQELPVELGNVTITSSQLVQQQKTTGRNITVIGGDQFRLLPVHAVDELLRYLPGVEVQQRGPQGSQSDINIRGGTFQQVLVIIDGVKLNDPLTGHFNSYIPIHPDEIERVEILKGAASAIYGPEAVGGVVNIITKTFAGTKPVKKHTATAGITAGEYRLLNARANYRHADQKSQFSAGFVSNNGNGQPLRGTTGFFHLHSGGIAYSRQLKNDWRFSIRTAGDRRHFNAQNYYTTFASDTASEKVNSWWSQASLSKKNGNNTFQADIAYKKLRDQYWFRPGSAPNDNRTSTALAQAWFTLSLPRRMSLTPGVQVLRKEIRSNDRGNHALWHGAAYVIFRQQPASQFCFTESIRLDWDENYGLILVPQLNAAWSPNKWTIRASAGRSVRDADFTERFNNYNKTLVTSGRIGNPDLGAEQSWNAEAGADYRASANLKFSGTLFYRHHTDLIDWAPTPYSGMPRRVNLSPTGSYALARNVESVKTSGAELDIVFNKSLNNKSSLLIIAGYTFLRSENKDSIPSFYISTHARHLLNFATVYRINPFILSVNGIYKHRNEQSAAAIKASITPSYFVLNAKAACQLLKNSMRIFIQADNLFNREYSDLLGSRMPGRWLSAGLDFSL